MRYGPASCSRSVFEYRLRRTLDAAVTNRASLLQAPVDKHPHGNCESCQQQEIKELIGRVNLHVRAGNELLICLEERKVLSQRWQVGSLEKKPAKLPFLGASLFTTLCQQTSRIFAPAVLASLQPTAQRWERNRRAGCTLAGPF